VLLDGRNFWRLHGRWAIATLIAALGATAWTVISARGAGRWPGGGSLSGLMLGLVAALIFLFEIALVVKKTKPLRTARWLLSAQTWMKAHIWLGLLTAPLVILHSGGRLGGTLTTVLVVVFAAVIVSGLWGLALQNLLPRLLLEAAPAETVYSEIERVGRQYAEEARRLVINACGTLDEGGHSPPYDTSRGGHSPPYEQRVAVVAATGAPRVVGPQIERTPYLSGEQARPVPSPAIHEALEGAIGAYLETGELASRVLGTRQRNQWYFEDLRLRVAPELRTLVGQLEELCERRRQLNVQQRLHFWLHNWLWVHLPVSVALMVLLAVHIVFALRYG
jgi:hypothetical protein